MYANLKGYRDTPAIQKQIDRYIEKTIPAMYMALETYADQS